MTDVSGVYGVQQSTYQAEETKSTNEINKDLFLQLLVTQLRHQDPLSEQQDMGDFITQLTMFTIVEQVTSMQKTMEEQKAASDSAMVLGLLNREVEVLDEAGETMHGIVSSVNFRQQQPYITVNGYEYPFSAVRRVEGGTDQDG